MSKGSGKMLRRLELICNILYQLSKWISIGTTMAIVFLNSANLLSRWIFRAPFDWILEVSLILFVYAVMFAVPVLSRDKGFIRMHLIHEVLGERRTKYINLVADCLVLAFFAYLLYQGLSLSLGQFEIHSRGLGIPRVYVTIPVSFAAALSIPIMGLHFLGHIRELKQK